MSEKVYVLNVYNTMTGQYELIQVTKEVFQAYRRTKWNIEDSTERFFKHETQMSSLIGGENDGYERFHEFIDYENTNEVLKAKVVDILRYDTFEDIIKEYDIVVLADKDQTKENLIKDLNTFYTKEEQVKYGVIGIRIKLL